VRDFVTGAFATLDAGDPEDSCAPRCFSSSRIQGLHRVWHHSSMLAAAEKPGYEIAAPAAKLLGRG
jgi:hypothetical protein